MQDFGTYSIYKGTADKESFRQWLDLHPGGFYLNKRSGKPYMLHKVGCHHLGKADWVKGALKEKICSEDAGKLREVKEKVEECGSCWGRE